MGRKASGVVRNSLTPSMMVLKTMDKLPSDTCFEVATPKVSTESKAIYQNYINVGNFGGCYPKPNDLLIYEKYASYK